MPLARVAAYLGAALDQVVPAAGTDPERPVLWCVLVEARKGSLRLVATDAQGWPCATWCRPGPAGERSAAWSPRPRCDAGGTTSPAGAI
jgi:hypothetical protein